MVALALLATLIAGDRVELRRPELRVGDVVRADVGRNTADRIVTLVPKGDTLTLSRTALVRLVRRAVPGLSVAPGGTGSVTICHASTAAADTSCWKLTRAVDAGGAIVPEMLARSGCDGRGRVSLRHDPQAGLVRAGRALDAGTAIGRLALPVPASVRTGETLLLTSTSGPVRVQRSVTAFQPGRAGGRVFVRAAEGAAFAVPVGERP